MDEHTHPMTETVTLFALEPAANGAAAAEQRHIEQLAAGLDLDRGRR